MNELQEAHDLRTPAARLDVLARSVRGEVQAAVAQHPSAPWPVLRGLIGRHTDAVLTNPALPLLELEHPMLWADLEWASGHVARSRHVPLSFVMWCLSYGYSDDLDDERWQLFQNLAVPVELRLRLLGMFQPKNGLYLGRTGLDVLVGGEWARRLRGLGLGDGLASELDPQLSLEDQRALHGLGRVTHRMLARHPATAPELISELMDSPVPEVVRDAARHPHLPDVWCELLVTSDDPAQREWVAHNPKLSQGLVCQLASQGPALVAEALALHPRLPDKMVREWAHRAPTRVRLQLVERPGLDPAVLAVLAADRASNVRAKVASLPTLPPALMNALAADPEIEVRRAVLANLSSPLPLRRHLEHDPEVVRRR